MFRSCRFAETSRALLVAACLCACEPWANAQPWVETERAQTALREKRFKEAAAAYRAITERNPSGGDAWSQLGYCLHADKQYEAALPAYARAIALGQNRPTNLYNSACACALLGRSDEALAWLEQALAARFADQETLENDSDLDALRGNPRFAELTGITRGLARKPAESREDGWKWDLDFYARRMQQMHWDLYGKVARDTFLGEIERLKQELAGLDDDQVRVRLRRITALVGDGHTSSRLTAEGAPRAVQPLHLLSFTDGLYVIGADPAQSALLGAKVLRIGPLDADAALTAVRPYICVDNDMGYLAQAPAMLVSPPILKAIGATGGASVEWTLQTQSGAAKTVSLEPVSLPDHSHGGWRTQGFQYLHEQGDRPLPLYLKDADGPLRIEHLPQQKLVYFGFEAVMNTPRASFAEIVKRLFDEVDRQHAQHLVIDMRLNGGGNTNLVRPLLEGLIQRPQLNQRGNLWVIIGRHTFSAAQNTVNLLDQQTRAVFVGEPTGSRPAFVGESTWFVLPHSRTRVYCSSRYWQYMDSTDERTWVAPDIAAPLSFADYAAGRDPALAAILECIDSLPKTEEHTSSIN